MAAGPAGGSRRGDRGPALLNSRPLLRGTCYADPDQQETTVGLLVVSHDSANRTTREVTACPVLRSEPAGPAVRMSAGWVSVGDLVPRAAFSLQQTVFTATGDEMAAVSRELADLLLIPELLADPLYRQREIPGGSYPRWGATYYAEPPLGGQTKRWLVVSHDHFNAASGDAVCVRTTSNTSYAGPEVPLIEGGTAAAVCPDVQTKAHHRFDTGSLARVNQAMAAERRRVAIGLKNYLRLDAR